MNQKENVGSGTSWFHPCFSHVASSVTRTPGSTHGLHGCERHLMETRGKPATALVTQKPVSAGCFRRRGEEASSTDKFPTLEESPVLTRPFHCLCSDILTSGGLADPGATAPRGLANFQRQETTGPRLLYARQPVQSPPPTCSGGLSHSGPLSTHPPPPGPGARQPGSAPAPHSSRKQSK